MTATNQQILTAEFAEKAATILRTLAHPVRLQIIEGIKTGEKSVSNIMRETNLSQTTCSQHLGLMRDRGLLRARRDGTSVYYSVAHPLVTKVFNCIRICITNGEK